MQSLLAKQRWSLERRD